MFLVTVRPHEGWPEARDGVVIPGLHEVPRAGDEPVSIVSLDNGEIHCVPSSALVSRVEEE